MSATRRLNTQVRNLLDSDTVGAAEPLAYLYRHHATSGLHSGEYQLAAPAGGDRFARFDFIQHSGQVCKYLSKISESVAAVNRACNDAAVTATGSWTTTADTGVYGGNYRHSGTNGDTLATTITGHTLFLRTRLGNDGGYAIVAVDGDYVNGANRLPVVTQAMVDAGHVSGTHLGKRYIHCYLASNTENDQQVCVYEGTDASHTVTVQPVGTFPTNSAGTKVSVVAFAAATAGTKPTDSNATLLATRWVLNLIDGFSSAVNVPTFTPTAGGSGAFLGEGHGNEALTSESHVLDGVAQSLTAGQCVGGQRVWCERLTQYNHPSSTGCATRRVLHLCEAGVPGIQNRIRVRWNVAGSLADTYAAMLPFGTRDTAKSSLSGYSTFGYNFDDWTKARFVSNRANPRVDAPVTVQVSSDGTFTGNYKAGTVALYSTAHDVVAMLRVAREDLATNDWAKGGASAANRFTSIQNRAEGFRKVYLARAVATDTESVAAGAVHEWQTEYRVVRIPNANSVLSI